MNSIFGLVGKDPSAPEDGDLVWVLFVQRGADASASTDYYPDSFSFIVSSCRALTMELPRPMTKEERETRKYQGILRERLKLDLIQRQLVHDAVRGLLQHADTPINLPCVKIKLNNQLWTIAHQGRFYPLHTNLYTEDFGFENPARGLAGARHPTHQPPVQYEDWSDSDFKDHLLQSAAHALAIWQFVPVNDPADQRDYNIDKITRHISPVALK
jgi:hypothetical protein